MSANKKNLSLESLESRKLMSVSPNSAPVDSNAALVAGPTTNAIPGDANLDGAFDQSDLVTVFQAAKYGSGRSANWSEGDWNGDRVFDTGDLVAAFRAGQYNKPRLTPIDDAYENNDTIGQAYKLGKLDSMLTIDRLSLSDSEDWFQFSTIGTGTDQSYVSVSFEHENGDIDIALYNSHGQLVRQSAGAENLEWVSLDGLSADNYYLQIYGYQGATNPSYQMIIEPDVTQQQHNDGYHTLFLNFDGINITPSDLRRWAGNEWASSIGYLDPENDGIRVQPFLLNLGSDRETYIRRIMENVQADLEPFGVTVQRIDGAPVEGVGASTIFIGESNIQMLAASASGVAGDIDRGNDNPMDIAFVQESSASGFYQSPEDAILWWSDVVIHETGHTYGLHHVDTVQDDWIYYETMGFGYSAGKYQVPVNGWQDVSFMDRTFTEFVTAEGVPHGPTNGNDPQNSYQTLIRAFQSNSATVAGAPVRFSADEGVYTLYGSDDADRVEITQTESGTIVINVNGREHVLNGAVTGIRIFTDGDRRDSITVNGDLDGNVELLVNRQAFGARQHHTKVDAAIREIWNGGATDRFVAELANHDHGVQDAMKAAAWLP